MLEEELRGIPGIPLTALPLNPTVQGGGLRTASGFPAYAGLAHQQQLETSSYKFIGSRTVCLANTPGIQCEYNVVSGEILFGGQMSAGELADFELAQLVEGFIDFLVEPEKSLVAAVFGQVELDRGALLRRL